MRRSNATLGHGKVDPKVAADKRGHDIDVSMNIYTKTNIKQRAAVARKLENVVLPEGRADAEAEGVVTILKVVLSNAGFGGGL